MLKTLSIGAIAAVSFLPFFAQANDLTLSIPLEKNASVTTETYKCSDSKEYSVRYINSDSNSLALIKLDDEDLVFVNAISGSGARYVSGAYEWETKGDDATLTNAMDEAAKLTCTATTEE